MKKFLAALCLIAICPLFAKADGTLLGGTNPPGVTVTSTTLPSGSTQYIQNTSTLQSGATFFVSSGTVQTKLTVPTGTAATDAVNFAQISGFRIVQISTASITTSSATTASNFSDTLLTASITPTSVTSKILIFVVQSFEVSIASTQLGWQLLRGASIISGPSTAYFSAAAGQEDFTSSMFVIDSPASVSPLTYKTQFARSSGAGTITAQMNVTPPGSSVIVLLEIN